MEVKELEEIVDDMILQHNYPGFEPRSLNIALPQVINEAPAKLYLAALASENVFVQLVSLRWLQKRPGATKRHGSAVAKLLSNTDAWVRLEAIHTLETAKLWDEDSILKVCSLLKDVDEKVREQAAKACGTLTKNLLTKSSVKEVLITALQEASQDGAQSVRRKAIKSLRKLGAFSIS